MLNIILPLVVISYLVSSWALIQVGMLLFCFLIVWSSGFSFDTFCLGYGMKLDYLSYILVLLSGWILSLIVSSSSNINNENHFGSLLLFVHISLIFILLLTFSCSDYLLFYISFESSLIPTLILILGWGYQPERIQAGTYMLFYTLLGSLPLLVSILFLIKNGVAWLWG